MIRLPSYIRPYQTIRTDSKIMSHVFNGGKGFERGNGSYFMYHEGQWNMAERYYPALLLQSKRII